VCPAKSETAMPIEAQKLSYCHQNFHFKGKIEASLPTEAWKLSLSPEYLSRNYYYFEPKVETSMSTGLQEPLSLLPDCPFHNY
jgi:hypothetical protein